MSAGLATDPAPIAQAAAGRNTDLARLSLNTATTKHLTLAEAAKAAAEAGLSAIGPWRDRVQEVGAEQAATILKDYGLRASSLCRGGFLTAATREGRDAALEDNKRAIEEAATLGTKELIMVVGGLSAATTPGGPAAPYQVVDGVDPGRDVVAARQRVADRIGELVPFASSHGVRLVIEPLHPMFAADRAVVSTIGQALTLCEPFESYVVGLVVDTYHVWWDPRLKSQIARAGQERRIASYQVCDFSLPFAAEPLNSRGHVGDGYVDFATITRWVTQAGYTGDIEVEIFNEEIWAAPAAQTLATMSERYLRHVAPFLRD
ncbi:sugar phosphate isomerase/epimerase family protein [Serinibacter salmoneus]|uniref:Sugar phosphate isomerase/epimerase n=1 Tax=Serinibacter salmoneus TaxID=556530 RepID=A0A2A9CWH9_9MICO|nr:sugar phosphate isomerase/epimerase family protein [Serinibacter salmoneus]PFG18784.1 sugar phosphate isomerase/epimerase [Serinibacter salmoneus]